MGVRMKQRPKRPIRARARPLPRLPQVALRWTAVWAVGGLVVGICLMLLKALPVAESSYKPESVSSYVSWVPVIALAGAAAGLGIGLLYACLMALTEEWRNSIEGTGIMVRLGPLVLCGAAAGLVAGLLAAGFGGALFFALLGACSAAGLNWKVARDG